MFKKLFESIIDYARESLPTRIWVKKDEEYILNPSVKRKIYKVMKKYPYLNLLDIAKEIRIVGSIGTNQFLDDADIDVHIVPYLEKLPKIKTPENWVKDIFKWYKENRKKIDAFIDKHPIEFYLQLNPNQDLMSASVYDLEKDKWIVGPGITPLAFDPYEKFKGLLKVVSKIAGGMDKLLGELKRDVIDYSFIKKAVKRMPLEQKKKLKEELQDKIKEIEEDIKELMKEKKDVLLMRKRSSSPENAQQALKDFKYIKNWQDANVVFKFLNRYQYFRLISDLEKMMEDDKISDEEIEDLKTFLGIRR